MRIQHARNTLTEAEIRPAVICDDESGVAALCGPIGPAVTRALCESCVKLGASSAPLAITTYLPWQQRLKRNKIVIEKIAVKRACNRVVSAL